MKKTKYVSLKYINMTTHISNNLKSHFLRLYQMAFADDLFDQLELKMLYDFARIRGIEKEQLNYLLLNPSHVQAIPDTLDEKIEYLYDLAQMIWADNKVTQDEKITLQKYCKKFGFLDQNIEELTDYLLKQAEDKKNLNEILKELNS